MNINNLQPNLINLVANTRPVGKTTQVNTNAIGGFSDILADTFRDANEMDAIDKNSTLQLLSGQADDFSGLLIDIQKAEMSLNLALQIRNKVIDAYNEIMRMQV